MPSGSLAANPEELVTFLQEEAIFEKYIIHFCKIVHKKFRRGTQGEQTGFLLDRGGHQTYGKCSGKALGNGGGPARDRVFAL
jgi:hypothetical protein